MQRYVVLLFSTLALVLGACSGPTEPTPVPPTPTPTAQDWLDRSVEVWNQTDSFHFTLDLDERTVALDEGGLLAFTQAEGDVVAPDRVQATALVRSLLGNAQLSVVAIGDDQWITNPLNGAWEQAPPEAQTEVTDLFDPEGGIGALLAEMDNLERLPDETVEGIPSLHLRGTLPGAALSAFAADLETVESLTVDLWVGTADLRIHRIVVTEPAANGSTPTWTFNFSDFNAGPTIEPPL